MSEVQRIREPTIVYVLETFPNGGCAHSKQIVEVIPRELISECIVCHTAEVGGKKGRR